MTHNTQRDEARSEQEMKSAAEAELRRQEAQAAAAINDREGITDAGMNPVNTIGG